MLVLGGDLAYPNPSTETYELRFVGPFEAALPPPPVSQSALQYPSYILCLSGKAPLSL